MEGALIPEGPNRIGNTLYDEARDKALLASDWKQTKKENRKKINKKLSAKYSRKKGDKNGPKLV